MGVQRYTEQPIRAGTLFVNLYVDGCSFVAATLTQFLGLNSFPEQ